MLLLLTLAGITPGCSIPEPEPEPGGEAEVETGGETGGESGDDVLALEFDGEVPTNVLMISVDTLRRDYVGRYDGSDRTPTLDRLLDEGFTLDDHRSCSSWTWPSVLCALSGRTIATLGVISPGPSDPPPPLPAGASLLPDWLKAQGYATGLVTANDFLTDAYGLALGYDLKNDIADGRPPTLDIGPMGLETLDALKATGAPWFLHLHYLDPHDPYSPPSGYKPDIDTAPVGGIELTNHHGVEAIAEGWEEYTDEEKALVIETLKALYRAEIRLLDDALEALLDALEARGDLDDTLVVIWSDHGEQFWEHGNWYHRQGLNDEEAAAVASFWAKSLRAGATRAPSTHLDLAPTLMAALGLALPADVEGALDGDIVGAFGQERPRFAHAMKAEVSLQSVDCRRRRLLAWWHGERRFYRLDEDPLELNNLYDPEDPEVIELEALLAPELERYRELAAGYDG